MKVLTANQVPEKCVLRAGAAAPWMNTQLLCARDESILVSGQR